MFPLSLSFPPASCYSRNREKNLIPEKRSRYATLSNDLLDLHNIMINIWRPLVDVLNGIRPGYMGGIRRSDTEWLQHFHLGNRLELELRKSEIIESLK